MVLLQVAIDGSSKAFKILARTKHVLKHLDEVLIQVIIGSRLCLTGNGLAWAAAA